jgi:peroxiredoxin
MRYNLKPGCVFPDYQLPDHVGVPRKLSELQGTDPLILTLARGHYCPKEHQQHLDLAAFYPKIAVAYTQVATISTDDHHTLQEFRASVGAQWTLLSDPDRKVQKVGSENTWTFGGTPAFLAMGAELAPKRLRDVFVTVLFASFPADGRAALRAVPTQDVERLGPPWPRFHRIPRSSLARKLHARATSNKGFRNSNSEAGSHSR